MAYLKKVLKEDEEPIRVIRRYPLSLLPRLILAFILIALPFFLMFPLFQWKTWGLPLFGLLLFIALVYILRVFTSWYFNLFIITNQRVIDVFQKGFFDKTVSAVNYSRIRDVAYRLKGMFQTIFKYGTVIIEISGTKVRLEVKNIKNPKEIQEIIASLGKFSQDSQTTDEFRRLVNELRAKTDQATEIPVRVKE